MRSERETEVHLLWTRRRSIWIRAKYRVITVFGDAEPNGRRDQLWDRDVAEVFLQSNESDRRRYKEFEISPNGCGLIWTSHRAKNRFEKRAAAADIE